jgi:biotin carboxylase
MPPQQELHDTLSTLSSVSGAGVMDQCVIIVDPYSTGCLVGKEIAKRGYHLVAVWTKGFSEDMKLHVPTSCGTMTYYAEIDEQETLQATADAVREATKNLVNTGSTGPSSSSTRSPIEACIAGGEAGVDLADALSEHLGLRTNGTQIPNRRDKKVQQELIRKTGLRSVRQACGSVFEGEVQDFLKTESFPLVLKPVESAGSDGVKLCHSFQEAKEHFDLLMSSQMVNGGSCPAVLCQEFLRGKEYVVDQ